MCNMNAPGIRKIAVLQLTGGLTADHRHTAAGAFEAFTPDIVFQFFVPDGLPNGLCERFIGCAGAEDCAQVCLFGGKETGAELPIGGQADAVTGRAEWLADGVNEADLADTVAEGVAARCFGGGARMYSHPPARF